MKIALDYRIIMTSHSISIADKQLITMLFLGKRIYYTVDAINLIMNNIINSFKKLN